MIYNTVSSKEIIAKVITDLRLDDRDYMVSDLTEWINEALDSIGAFRQYNIKVTGKEDEPLLTVSNYQTQLPKDLHKVVFIQYGKNSNGPFIPIKWNTNPVMMRGETNSSSTSGDTAGDMQIVYFTMDLMDLNYQDALTLLNTDSTFKDKINSILTSEEYYQDSINSDDGYTHNIKYTINNNYIKLNVSDGYIRLVYLARPIDADNYPLVPDLQSFRDALYWYINMKLMYPDWALGRIRDRVYEHAESKWRFFSKQAYAEGIMPDIGQLESMKEQWNQLFPEIYSYDTNFTTLSDKQIIYN